MKQGACGRPVFLTGAKSRCGEAEACARFFREPGISRHTEACWCGTVGILAWRLAYQLLSERQCLNSVCLEDSERRIACAEIHLQLLRDAIDLGIIDAARDPATVAITLGGPVPQGEAVGSQFCVCVLHQIRH